MEKETKTFIEASQSMLRKVLQDGGGDPQWINMLKAWSQGVCFCGVKLVTVSVERSESGVTRRFECGHAHTAISLQETIKMEEGFSASSMGMTAEGQSISVRAGGKQVSKENRE